MGTVLCRLGIFKMKREWIYKDNKHNYERGINLRRRNYKMERWNKRGVISLGERIIN